MALAGGVEGSERMIVKRRTVERDAADVFDALPREFKETISEVHYANGELNVGQIGAYGIDVNEEWLARITGGGEFERPSNLIEVVRISQLGRGLRWQDEPESRDAATQDIEDFGVDPLEPHLADAPPFPEIVDPDMGTGQRRYYRLGPPLDQGTEGACTGFCGANFLNCGPMMVRPFLADQDGFDFYSRNRQIDEWPGENYSGSSVTAMCKQLVELGRIEKWAVTTSFEEMVRWKLAGAVSGAGGTLMLSTPWYEGMYVTDATGYVRPTGRRVGGHAILDRGVSEWRSGSWFNSWGAGFGNGGVGSVSEADYRWLISQGLRAYCAIQTA